MGQGFSHFLGFLHYFVLAKLATSSIRVNGRGKESTQGKTPTNMACQNDINSKISCNFQNIMQHGQIYCATFKIWCNFFKYIMQLRKDVYLIFWEQLYNDLREDMGVVHFRWGSKDAGKWETVIYSKLRVMQEKYTYHLYVLFLEFQVYTSCHMIPAADSCLGLLSHNSSLIMT